MQERNLKYLIIAFIALIAHTGSVVADGQFPTILDFWVLSLRQVSVFWVKKLMSMTAQLYDDFFTEFIYTNNQRLQRYYGQ